MIEIHAVKVPSSIENTQYTNLLSLVTKEKAERIQRFVKQADRYRSLLADVLVRRVICKKFQLANEELQFFTNEYGRPFLKHVSDFSFNVSHSGDWVVCVSHELPVGIDVEMIKPIDLAIADRFFSREESEDLYAKSDVEQLLYFFDLWTLKESYIKAVGKGLSIPLDSFTMKRYSQDHIEIIQEDASYQWYFKQYEIDNRHKLSVCASDNEFAEDVAHVDVHALINSDI